MLRLRAVVWMVFSLCRVVRCVLIRLWVGIILTVRVSLLLRVVRSLRRTCLSSLLGVLWRCRSRVVVVPVRPLSGLSRVVV